MTCWEHGLGPVRWADFATAIDQIRHRFRKGCETRGTVWLYRGVDIGIEHAVLSAFIKRFQLYVSPLYT